MSSSSSSSTSSPSRSSKQQDEIRIPQTYAEIKINYESYQRPKVELAQVLRRVRMKRPIAEFLEFCSNELKIEYEKQMRSQDIILNHIKFIEELTKIPFKEILKKYAAKTHCPEQHVDVLHEYILILNSQRIRCSDQEFWLRMGGATALLSRHARGRDLLQVAYWQGPFVYEANLQ